jgi:type II restriction enzyme
MVVCIDLGYKSRAQRARVQSEAWVGQHGFCPACGDSLFKTPNNTRALDFLCSSCQAPFELKSMNGRLGNTIPDGAYEAMVGAIRGGRTPNLFLLQYSLPFAATNLVLLPKHFLVEPIVIKRRPLSPTARRKGWVGCNLDLKLLPRSAFVQYVTNGVVEAKRVVMERWAAAAALAQVPSAERRGWLTVTLALIDRIGRTEFSLADVYFYEPLLARLFPENKNIRPKLRQQLQVLRDLGQIAFRGNGKYMRLGVDKFD